MAWKKLLLAGDASEPGHAHLMDDVTDLDHGGLAGLADDDHTQYVLRSILTTRGDIYVRDASAVVRLAKGAEGTVLRAGADDPAWTTLYAQMQVLFVPDASPAATVVAGDAQGHIGHSGAGFTATKLYVDAETAPGAAGLPITVQYGDTDDLDTVTAWTTIATLTLSSEKSANTTTMTNATVPASRLLRMNVGTIVGTPKDVTVTLEGKRGLVT